MTANDHQMRERMMALAELAYQRELSGLLHSAQESLHDRGVSIAGASLDDMLRLVPDLMTPADELWVKYHRTGDMLPHVIALSIVCGILDRAQIDGEVIQELSQLLTFYRETPMRWNDWARGSENLEPARKPGLGSGD